MVSAMLAVAILDTKKIKLSASPTIGKFAALKEHHSV